MSPTRSEVSAVSLFLIVAVVASCSDERKIAGPSALQPSTVTDVVMTGPDRITPGASAQFRLSARFSDGTERDVTNQTTWSSSNSATTITINGQTGLAVGRSVGESNISARYRPPGQTALTRTTSVLVMPEGTFRMLGRVAEPGGLPVPDASIDVLTGNGAGQRRVTAPDGRFRLYGVSGATRIIARKSGYRDDSRDIVITSPDQEVDFELQAPGPIEDLTGAWVLTITASASCAALPEDARVRTYAASIAQSARELDVTLSGATFVGSNHRITGRVEPTPTVTFQLGFFGSYYYYYGPYGSYLIEQIATNRLVTIVGSATTTLTGNTMSGSFSGNISLRTTQGTTRCSGAHQFRLVRQN